MANKRPAKSTTTTKAKKASPSRNSRPQARSAKRANAKPVQEVSESPVKRDTTQRTTPALRFKKSYVILALAAVLLLGLLYAARGLFVAATVNGQPISRIALIQELERQSGKQTLDSLVTKSLILQEAKKKNVQITDQQIDEEIKKIDANLKQQGQNLEQVLSLQGLTRESLRDQVRIQKTVEALLGNDIKVTGREVDDYIASNSASLPADANPEELKTNITQQLRQQKLSERFQTWLAGLRQNAKINYIVNY
jgi:parvulin-like peptidyl-prolyl isomerase